MANLYLMQALYTPKPPLPTPTPEVPALDGDQVHQRNQTTANEHAIHDARRKLMESEGLPEPDAEIQESWRPTGSNIQPIAIKSEFPRTLSDTSSRAFPSLHGTSAVMPSPHSLFQTTLPNGLIYRIEQYLPPPGPYYDQGSLIAVFGMAIFRSKSCTICWTRHPSGGFSSKSCGKQCKICGTRRHPDESCSLLYCNRDWYRQHEIQLFPETVQNRQIRPDKHELGILCRIGVLSQQGGRGAIHANKQHPIVQAFYKDKAEPRAMSWKIFEADLAHRSTCNTPRIGSLPVANAPPQQALPPPMRPYAMSKTVVNSSLDPRLQGRKTLSAPVRPAPTQTGTAIGHVDANPTDPQDTETKLQEQEVEILNLRMQAVVKDREIRKLKAEIEQLRIQAANPRVAH